MTVSGMSMEDEWCENFGEQFLFKSTYERQQQVHTHHLCSFQHVKGSNSSHNDTSNAGMNHKGRCEQTGCAAASHRWKDEVTGRIRPHSTCDEIGCKVQVKCEERSVLYLN